MLARQLNRVDAPTYSEHVKKAADFIAANGPYTPQERWENQSGWSPGTIAAEIAGLICAADIARRNGDVASAQRWETVADDWQSQVDAWTATSNGPYSPKRRRISVRSSTELPRARAPRHQAPRQSDGPEQADLRRRAR